MMGGPNFSNPPIVEIVLGAQFSPLTKLTSGHFGLFWKELEDCWVEPGDGPLIEDQFELFDQPRRYFPGDMNLHLEPIRLPGRFTIGHRGKDRLLQIQATRFHLNWRKGQEEYPNYRRIILEFESLFGKFSDFIERAGLGKINVNQWELTYVNSFLKGEYWNEPKDWAEFLPGLFGSLFPTANLGLRLERRAAEWSFEIEPKRGRLRIAANSGRTGENEGETLLVQMTARGPVGKGGAATLREGLDIGHETALGVFLRAVSDDTKIRWKPKS